MISSIATATKLQPFGAVWADGWRYGPQYGANQEPALGIEPRTARGRPSAETRLTPFCCTRSGRTLTVCHPERYRINRESATKVQREPSPDGRFHDFSHDRLTHITGAEP